MTYSTTDLVLLDQPVSGVQEWMYTTLDSAIAVLAANYISDAKDRGLQPGDIVTIRVAATESAYDDILTIANIVEATVMSVSALGAVLSTVPQVFVGDIGSGGVAGSVPSPAAGDALAGKVLGAGGGWVAPSAWVSGANLDNVARLGIGTTDNGNVLSVKGATSLFASVTDCRVTVSKNAVGNTAAVNFQDNYSTRVQFGLLGNDSFTIATSADGSTFHNALIATTAGVVSFPNTAGFTGDSGAGGTVGLVPAPATGDTAGHKFLSASGSWARPAAADVSGLGSFAAISSLASSALSDQTTAGVGMFTAATVAAQTALLNAVVGDSGAGGTKGMVPAPAAGDTAANKVLGAGGGWVTPSALVNSQNLDGVTRLGIGTTDTGNNLSVSGASSLFSNGAAGVQVTLSKHAAGDTASFVFKTNFSGRAEFGLCGDDNFTMKVSADGSSWNNAIVIDKTTAAVSISKSLKVAVVTYANRPTAPAEGEEINFSDATVNTWGTTISAGSGGYHVKARYNGSAWTVVGI